MTTERNMAAKYAEINGFVRVANNACLAISQEKDVDKNVKILNDTMESLASDVEVYNQMLAEQEYDKWLASESPVFSAIQQAIIPQIAVKQGKIKDTEIMQVSIATKNVQVDLLAFDEYALDHEVQAFANPDWQLKVDRLCKFISARILRDVENADASKNKVADEAGNVKDLLSNKSIKEIAQSTINGIIEGYTFKTKDVNFLLATAAKHKSGGYKVAADTTKIVMPRKATLVRLITAALHRIITNGEYTPDEK